VALDLALSIASGQPTFLGLPLCVSGPVVYVVGEGAGRFRLRLQPWKHHHAIDEPLPFYWMNGPINLLDDAEVERFVAALQDVQPALVVIDTLSRCIVGADENSQAAMTQTVAALDRVRLSVSGLTVLVLHHMNAAATRERGSTVLNGALDTQIMLRRPTTKRPEDEAENITAHGRIDLVVTKQKDLDELSRPIVLYKHEVTIDGEYEANGRPATSLVWTRPEHTMPLADRVLAFVRANPGVTKNAVLTDFGGKREAFYRAVSELEAAGRLIVQPAGAGHQLFAV
jgi:hypothetical protein